MRGRKYRIIWCVIIVIVLASLVVACNPTDSNFSIKFMNGDKVHYTLVIDGSEITLPKDPVKEGYIFAGWYFDKDVWSKPVNEKTLKELKLEKNIKVYAKWDKEDEDIKPTQKITISFDTNGGSEIADIVIDQGSTITLPDEPTKAGFIFDGWYTDKALTVPFEESALELQDTLLYAKWATAYSIVVDKVINGSIIANRSEGKQGETVTLTIAPNKGYKLTENSLKINNGEVAVTINGNMATFVMLAKNVEVTAEFETIKYRISYANLLDGTNTNDYVEYTVETPTITFVAPQRIGYEGSWDIASITQGSTGDKTITAVWEAIQYSININSLVNEAIVADKSSAGIGETVTLTIAPNSGYKLTENSLKVNNGEVAVTIAGDTATFIMPAQNIDIIAEFDVYITKDLEYKLIDGDLHYSVVGKGAATDIDIVIPSEYNNKPVTSIGVGAFRDCLSLTSITIPNREESNISYHTKA